jgi:hypothetical protein
MEKRLRATRDSPVREELYRQQRLLNDRKEGKYGDLYDFVPFHPEGY